MLVICLHTGDSIYKDKLLQLLLQYLISSMYGAALGFAVDTDFLLQIYVAKLNIFRIFITKSTICSCIYFEPSDFRTICASKCRKKIMSATVSLRFSVLLKRWLGYSIRHSRITLLIQI